MAQDRTTLGSFRDPSGTVFTKEGVLYRSVRNYYSAEYALLLTGGLYEELVKASMTVSHEEVEEGTNEGDTYKVIRPERIPFVSYPYEWSFNQLKDAALLTLKIQRIALGRGMTLKDASAYNIQFRGYRPVLIDTLSFEKYEEGKPWIAYGQFCRHFLAPLSMMGKSGAGLGQLLKGNIDGIPLDLASRTLPWHTYLRPSLLTHIHMHSKAQRLMQDRKPDLAKASMPKRSLLGLIDSLESAIDGIRPPVAGTIWTDYYSNLSYSDESLDFKAAETKRMIERVSPSVVWDIGANTGLFSRISSDMGIYTVALEADHSASDICFMAAKREKRLHLLPLVMDIANPSPAIGWANSERMSLAERGPADMVLALALIHHLAIANNVPLGLIADFLAMIAKSLLIEFVPKSDVQVQRMLSTRKDIFTDYSVSSFESAFAKYFDMMRKSPINGSGRTLYLFRNKAN